MILDNTKTRNAMERIYFETSDIWDDEKYLLDSSDYAMELEDSKPVLEGVIRFLNREGENYTEENRKEIVKELNKRYKNIGITEGIPRPVRNWLDGNPVGVTNRKNLYDLCIVLGLNEEETVEFFLKYYMTLPFNYKNKEDAIYFYCIHNNKTYDYVKMFESVQVESDTKANNNILTKDIGNMISEISDDNVFMEYLSNNEYDLLYITARKEILHLMNQNALLAEKERNIKSELRRNKSNNDGKEYKEPDLIRESKNRNKINDKALLDIIYGYDDQYHHKNGGKSISKCNTLPKRFREGFPNDQEITDIKLGRGSADTIRKALIILKYYNFFCSELNNYSSFEEYYERYGEDEEEINEALDDFYWETSALLEKCGFVQLYARNPFDWLILFCAKSLDPMDALRELLRARWLENED